MENLKVLLSNLKYLRAQSFKINIVRLADKYPKMMILSVTLNFLKSYYLDIKNICKENHEDFK